MLHRHGRFRTAGAVAAVVVGVLPFPSSLLPSPELLCIYGGFPAPEATIDAQKFEAVDTRHGGRRNALRWSMPRFAPLPEELHGRSFTLRQALDADLSRSRTRAGDLVTPSREVRVPVGVAQPVLSRCRPYVQLLPRAFVSHTTAAEVHGIHLPPWISCERLHLSRGRQSAAPRRKGVTGHRLDVSDGDVVEVDGVAVTSVSRTWLDLATVLPLEDLIVAGDQIVSEHVRSFGLPKTAMVPKHELAGFVARV